MQELLDREQIRDLLLEYGRSFDERRLEDYADLFADEGEWVNGKMRVRGRAEILRMVTEAVDAIPMPPGSRNYHLMSNMMVNVDGDRATAWSRFTFIAPDENGTRIIAGSGVYDDVLVRGDGGWKFLRRELTGDYKRPPQ